MNRCKKCKQLTNNNVFCSNRCSALYRVHVLKIGPFFDSKIQSELGKRAAIINKKNKTGFWGLTKQQRINAVKKSNITNKKNKTGAWNSRTGQLGSITNIRNHTGAFHDKKIQIKGGLAALHTLRFNIRNLKFNGQYYDSVPEIEISLCLCYQYNYIPKENKTLHKRIGKCEYDYLLEKLKLFIEFHQWFQNETKKQYYERRRKNLDRNGYKNYKLIIIK